MDRRASGEAHMKGSGFEGLDERFQQALEKQSLFLFRNFSTSI